VGRLVGKGTGDVVGAELGSGLGTMVDGLGVGPEDGAGTGT
jgi:hypothetical protein